jgi:MFS family permease
VIKSEAPTSAGTRADETRTIPPIAPEPPGQLDERTIVSVTALGHAVCHIGELVFTGVMVVVMQEFGLAPHQATSLALLGYILMGAGALPVGIWADTWGPTRVLLWYFLAMSLTSIGVALASNEWLLFLALTGLGLATSIYHPTGVAMISLGVKARGRAMGINGVAGSIGVATGPLLGMWAASWGWWRLAYIFVALLSLASAALLYVATRRLPHKGAPRRLPDHPPAVFPRHHAVHPGGSRSRGPSRKFLPLAGLFVAMMLGGFNYRCLVTALPPFLSGTDTTATALFAGGALVFVTLVIGGVGQYLGGWTADYAGARRVYPVLIALLVLFALVLGSLEGSALAAPVASFLAIALFAQQPVENSLLAEWTSAGRRSVSYGTKFALTFGVGALGAHVVGIVWHYWDSLAPVFYLIAASAALMGLLSAGAIRNNPPDGRPEKPANNDGASPNT